MTHVVALVSADQADMYESLLTAIHHGDFATVQTLITEQPSLVNTVDDTEEQSAFELALSGGMSKIATLLLEQDSFDVNHQDHHPLRLAIELGYLEIAEQLLKKGCNPNYRPQGISSALLLCLEKEYFELAALMVQHGAEVNMRNDKGWTPLIWAAIKGRKSAVEFLISHQANIHLCNNDGWNAITGAYFKKRMDIVTILQDAGAVFGASYSEAALLSAYKNGYLDIVDALLAQGVTATLCDEDSIALIIHAAENGQHALLKKLIEYKVDVNCRNKESDPLILLLAQNGHTELVKLIIAAGADVNLANDKGVTALYRAACYNQLETAKLLIECGANVNGVTINQWTPLMAAARDGYKAMVETLLAAQANTQLTNKDGRTAKAVARQAAPRETMYKSLKECAHKEIIELLTLPGHFIDAN